MNILLINDASYRPCLTGHTVVTCGAEGAPYIMPGQNDFDFLFPDEMIQPVENILSKLPQGFFPDLIIFTECYRNYFFLGIEKLGSLLVWRPIDNHIHSWQPNYAPFFHIVFNAQKNHTDRFVLQNQFSFWLPLNLFPEMHFNRNLARDIDVSFVGNMDKKLKPQRVEFLEKLTARVSVTIFQNLNHSQMADVYNRSKIVLNECMNFDLNYRFFEAMGNGALLLTPPAAGLEDFFRDEQELVLYPNYDADSCAEKITAILSNWNHYSTVAHTGEQAVHEHHSLQKRTDTMMEIIMSQGRSAYKHRQETMGWHTYLNLIPVFTAFYTMNFSEFDGIDYLLTEMFRYNPELTIQKCHELELFFGNEKIAGEFRNWADHHK